MKIPENVAQFKCYSARWVVRNKWW